MLKRFILITMPFADISMPSIGITQIKYVIDEQFQGEIETEILYLNHDFAHFFGIDLYQVVNEKPYIDAAMGDWLFRDYAFSDLDDNIEEYFERFFNEDDLFKEKIREKRKEIGNFLEKMVEKYNLAQADYIGFTSMFYQHVASIAMAKLLKQKNKNIVTMVGGANCEGLAALHIAKNINVFDYVFSGASLISYPKFFRNHLAGKIEQINEIDGVFLNEDARIQGGMNECKEKALYGLERPLDQVVELDYSSFLDSYYKNFSDFTLNPVLFFETSRGCRWGEKCKCSFCGINGADVNFRWMSSDKAIAYINKLLDQYKEKCTRFESVDNLIPDLYVEQVFPYLHVNEDTMIFMETRVEMTDKEIKTLVANKVNYVQPGIESLVEEHLKLMKKGTSVLQNLQFLRNASMYGLNVTWNILVGVPGESYEPYYEYVKLLPKLFHLYPPRSVFPISYTRYSDYYMEPEKYNIQLVPVEYYSYIFPFTSDSMMEYAFFYDNVKFSEFYTLKRMKMITKTLTIADKWKERWRSEKCKQILPELYFIDKNRIYDSRGEEALYHKITDLESKILELFDRPSILSEVQMKMDNVSLVDIEHAVEHLDQLGLIYTNGIKYLSLVSLRRPEYPMNYREKLMWKA